MSSWQNAYQKSRTRMKTKSGMVLPTSVRMIEVDVNRVSSTHRRKIWGNVDISIVSIEYSTVKFVVVMRLGWPIHNYHPTCLGDKDSWEELIH